MKKYTVEEMNTMIIEHDEFIKKTADHYVTRTTVLNRVFDKDDFYQEARLLFMKAVSSYIDTYECSLHTYASKVIRNGLYDFIRNQNTKMHLELDVWFDETNDETDFIDKYNFTHNIASAIESCDEYEVIYSILKEKLQSKSKTTCCGAYAIYNMLMGKNYTETANELGVSRGYVGVAARRLQEMLKKNDKIRKVLNFTCVSLKAS